jgi:hypothetical protein
MLTANDPSAFNARIETLTHALDASADREAQASARELVGLTLEFHRAGLERILAIMNGQPPSLTQRLAADPIVAALLALHELMLSGPAERILERAPIADARLIQISRRPPPVDRWPLEAHAERASRCERCAEPLSERHHHEVDVASRRLSCCCRACWLLSAAARGSGSLRAVPDRYLHGPGLQWSAPQWDALQVPVSMAFFMFNSILGRTIAFYPSPAGATESALSLAAWREVESANPWTRDLSPDVEALLVRKPRGSDVIRDCFIVPIDACYDLVGRIRLRWRGFDGGDDVRAEIDRFFADVAARSAGASG